VTFGIAFLHGFAHKKRGQGSTARHAPRQSTQTRWMGDQSVARKQLPKMARKWQPAAGISAPFVLVDKDIQALTGLPQVNQAAKRLNEAVAAISGLDVSGKRQIPARSFQGVVRYEDALGQFTAALIASTYQWLLNGECPLCGTPLRKGNLSNR
jgi:hypothetical protein